MSLKKLLFILFIGSVVFDCIRILYPEYVYGSVSIYFPIPILMIMYLINCKKMNYMYVMALVFTCLGVVLVNKGGEVGFGIGIISYAIGVILYCIIIIPKLDNISTRSILYLSLPFLLVFLIPYIYYSDYIVDSFLSVAFYVFSVGFFALSSILVYISSKTKTNSWLMYSGSIFIISTIVAGYGIFVNKTVSTSVFIVISFNAMHYCMGRYVLLNKKINNSQIKLEDY